MEQDQETPQGSLVQRLVLYDELGVAEEGVEELEEVD